VPTRALRIREAAPDGEPGEARPRRWAWTPLAISTTSAAARRAQLLAVQGDFRAAAALHEVQLPEAVAAGPSRIGGCLLADQAAVEVLAEDSPHCDLDECAAWRRLGAGRLSSAGLGSPPH